MKIFALLLVIASQTMGQPLTAPAESPASEEVLSSRRVPLKEMMHFQETWFARKKALTSGDTKSANEALDKIYQEKLNMGLRNLFLYSASLVREGEAISKRGDVKGGLEIVERAIALSPDLPSAYFSAFGLSLKNLDVGGAMFNLVRGIKAIPRSFFYTLSFLGNILFYTLGALLLSYALYTIILFLKYTKLFSHDIGDLFPGNPPRVATFSFGLLVLLLPLLIGVGPLWLIAWCILLTFPYGNRGEKAVSLVFFLFLITSPEILRMVSSFLSSSPSGLVNELARTRVGDWDVGMEESMKKWANDNPGDSDVLLSIGLISKKKGDLRTALEYYDKALVHPGRTVDAEARLRVNKGNVLMGLGDLDGAIREYKKSIKLLPGLASAHYNLGQVYMKKGMIEGEGELRIAKEIDPELTAFYTELYAPSLNRLLIDEEVPVDVLVLRFISPTNEKEQIMNDLFVGVMKGVSVEKVPLVGGCLIFLSLILYAFLRKFGLAHSCERCGRPACVRCTEGVKTEFCPQCYGIYVSREISDANARVKKDAEIRRYMGRWIYISRFFSFVLPGSGQMIRGDAVQGIIFSFIFALLALKIVFSIVFGGGIVRFRFPLTSLFTYQMVILIMILVCWYVISLFSFRRGE